MTDPFAYGSEEAEQARRAVNNAADHGQRALGEAIGAAERTIAAAMKAAESLLKDSLAALRAQTNFHMDGAVRQLGEGQRNVVAQVRQRPLAATLAGIGVGLLIGLLLSRRSK